jgi:bifunctional ADP-heptose synthase (sugar kinase/adenylyltransferase)
MEMVKALKCVDDVRAYNELEYVSACKELDVDIFVVGGDWGDKPHNIAVEEYLKSKGKKIVQVNYNSQTSSTRIKQNVITQSQNSKKIDYVKSFQRTFDIKAFESVKAFK